MTKDDLLLLGFDELTDSELKELEGELSPEEKKELEAWTTIREDLKALRDIPPCQLTSEHLREAILRNGMKPAPAKPIWMLWVSGAGLAAAACFATAAWMTFNNFQPTLPSDSTAVAAEKAPSIVKSSDFTPVAKAVKKAPPVIADAKVSEDPEPELDMNNLVASNAPRIPVNYVARNTSRPDRRQPSVASMEAASTLDSTPALEGVETRTEELTVPAPVMAASTPQDSIVVISAPPVGAEAAPPTEVGRTVNVVFGG